jgi:hypothetical protein
MNKRPNRLLAFLLAPAMLLLPTSGGGPDQALAASAPAATIDLERCLLTVHFLYEPDENRFVEEGYMPEGYTPASVANLAEPLDQQAARVEIWAFNCGAVGTGGGDPAPGMLTLTSMAIQGRPAHHHWAGISDNYLFWAQTDRADIANVLEAAGVPVSLVEGMTFGWRQGPLHPWEGPTRVQVPWATSPYALGVRGLPGTNTPHYHDNTFQHADPSRGKSSLKLNVLLPPAQDLLCARSGRLGR